MELGKLLSLLSKITGLLAALVLFIFLSAVVYQLYPELFFDTNKGPWKIPTLATDLPDGSRGQLIKYGYYLTSESSRWMGPGAINPDHRYSGNNLACKNCHLENGTQPGSASWVGVTKRYPQYRGREDRVGTIEDRINGCMERSMNGERLPEDSRQMKAIVAYMEWLSSDMPDSLLAHYSGFPPVELPDTPADTLHGRLVYERECVVCHGAEGQGVWLADSSKGYQYPPVWGEDSYNHGAGMNRVITAARFIKGNMPFGQATAGSPKLTDQESLDVAAYIDSFNRPEKAGVASDYPDPLRKPVSTPYGPWPDSFPALQHKYGPFKPIIRYYDINHDIRKTQ